MQAKRLGITFLASASICLFASSACHALIIHQSGWELSSPTSASGPDPTWFAKWSVYGAAIAVAPNYVLAPIHLGGSSTVVFPSGVNAGTYNVLSETIIQTGIDLKLVKIDGTLPSYASVYSGSTIIGSTVVIGGFGPNRGTDDATGTTLNGYNLATPTSGNGHSLVFGQNRVDSLSVLSAFGDTDPTRTNTPLLRADFDAPDNLQSPYSAVSVSPNLKVPYEAGLGDGDSGGGWFVFDAGQWKLTGLSEAAQLNNSNTQIPFGAIELGTDIRTYAPQIAAIVPEPTTLGLLILASLTTLRRRR